MPLAQPKERLVVADERVEPADGIAVDRRRFAGLRINDDGGPVGLAWRKRISPPSRLLTVSERLCARSISKDHRV
jgi:hypothetical protein